MDEFEDAAMQRTADYNLYFRLMSEGLSCRTAHEFRDEMEVIAMHTSSPALRKKCEIDAHRFDEAPVIRAATH